MNLKRKVPSSERRIFKRAIGAEFSEAGWISFKVKRASDPREENGHNQGKWEVNPVLVNSPCHQVQSLAIALRSPANKRSSDLKRYSPDFLIYLSIFIQRHRSTGRVQSPSVRRVGDDWAPASLPFGDGSKPMELERR